MFTITEIGVYNSEKSAERAAADHNSGAFPGQRYSVDTGIVAGKFVVVLSDGGSADNRDKLTKLGAKVDSIRSTESMGGERHFRRATTGTRTFG